MQFSKIGFLLALAATIVAQDVDNNDLPQQCRDVCANLVQWTQSCDNNNTDEQAVQCVCGSADAGSVVPACDACVRNFNNGDGGDVHDILTSCSFTTTSYNAAAASTSASAPSSASSGSASAAASASSSASAPASAASSAGASAAQSSAPAQQTANEAPAHAAAAGLGIFGLAFAIL